MFPRRTVLIVDSSQETREVLRTALASSETQVFEATRADQGLELARRHHPSVIVLDVDLDSESRAALGRGLSQARQQHPAPLVVLGNARKARRDFPDGQFVAKPYHYAPLIRKIEQLLQEVQQSLADHSGSTLAG